MSRTSEDYTERLFVPLRWWVQTTMLLATLWLAFVVALPLWVANLVTGVIVAAVYGVMVAVGRVSVRVADGELHAGAARIPVHLLGPAEALDPEATRRVHGVEADARAYLLTRPYLRRSVRVPVTDPRDPTPYWLVSTRHPRRLAEAITAASGRAGAGSP
ncbi:DUF3093 domain-containing protein [Nocardioides marmoraquaticus]